MVIRTMTGETSVAKIGVGIIGAAPDRSWAAKSHIPALHALPDYEIRALSTTRQASADAAAAEFGVPHAYDNHAALINSPEVDLVVVAVKVPHHYELVKAAIAAGKHVFCEWPLGNGLAETEELAALAKAAGVRTAVGLQARSAPVFGYVRDLIAQGYVGEVLSTTLVGSGMIWGPAIDQPSAYAYDRTNGATMLTIPFGHTIDAISTCLGEIVEVSALLANRRRDCLIMPEGIPLKMTAEDQLVVNATFASGAIGAIHYRGGMSRGTNLRWEVNGSEGDLVITGDTGHAQMFSLSLFGGHGEDQGVQAMTVPPQYQWTPDLPMFAQNVAQAYVLFANDLRNGTNTCPTFDDAVIRHRLIEAVAASAASGQRCRVVGV